MVVVTLARFMSSKRPLSLIGIGVVCLVPLAVLWMAATATGSAWPACGVPPTPPPIEGPYVRQVPIVVACAVAFLVGHLLSNLTPAPSPDDLKLEASASPMPRISSQAVIVGGLLVLCLVPIVYETISLLNESSLVAITYYVRCANVIHNVPTVAGAVAVTFFVGRWLRFPWWVLE